MIKEALQFITELAREPQRAVHQFEEVDLQDGRRLLRVAGGGQLLLQNPDRLVLTADDPESFVALIDSHGVDVNVPIYFDGQAFTVRHVVRDGGESGICERWLSWSIAPHPDFKLLGSLQSRNVKPRGLYQMGRTTIANLFMDSAQRKAWCDTWKTVTAKVGAETRSAVRAGGANYGSDVHAEFVSAGGGIEQWEQFHLRARLFEGLEYRSTFEVALVDDPENGTASIHPVGETLTDGWDDGVGRLVADVRELIGDVRPLIYGSQQRPW